MNVSSHRPHHTHIYFTFINVTNTTEKHSEVRIKVLPIVWSYICVHVLWKCRNHTCANFIDRFLGK
jgi:hypothetical protein